MFLINLNDFISSSKYIANMIKISDYPILESNSGPLDFKSDSLPVELSKSLRFEVPYIEDLTTARMSDKTRISEGKKFYFI